MAMSPVLLRPRRGVPVFVDSTAPTGVTLTTAPREPTAVTLTTAPLAPTGVGLTGSPGNLESVEVFAPDAPTGVTATPSANAPSSPTGVTLSTAPSSPTGVGLTGQPGTPTVEEVFVPDAPTGVTLTPQASTDPYFSDVVLLLQDSLADESLQGQTVVANGDAQISTTQVKYGTHSLAFDGNGDYLSVASPEDFSFGTGDFTIEAWVFCSNPSATSNSIAAGDAQGNWMLAVIQNKLQFGRNIIAWDLSSPSQSWGGWHHVSVSRENGTLRLFKDGSLIASQANSLLYDATNNIYVGARRSGVSPFSAGEFWNGYLDDFRVTKGIARYTSAFTPPTAAFPATNGDPDFASVVLLLQDSLADESLQGQTVVVSGNVSASTSQVKVGTHSLYFDGAGDWATIANTAMAFGTGPFTVEFWMYWDGTVTGTPWMGVMGVHNSSGTGRYGVFMNNGGITHYLSSQFPSTASISASTWHHIASTRDASGNCRLFVDGVLKSEVVDAGNIVAPEGFRVGNEFTNGRPPFSGYLDAIRITKGVGRYTSNFTPPTQAFPN